MKLRTAEPLESVVNLMNLCFSALLDLQALHVDAKINKNCMNLQWCDRDARLAAL